MNDPLTDTLKTLSRPRARDSFRNQVRQEFLQPARQPRRLSKAVWLVGSLAACLALALGFWGQTRSSAPQWHLMTTGGSEISGSLHNPGPGELQVEIENSIRWRLMPGTTVQLFTPKSGGPLKVHVTQGVALATTGPDFPPEGLLVTSDFLDIAVTGTTFGVLAGADSTCICVFEGVVTVNRPDPYTIPPGMVLTRFASQKPIEGQLEGIHGKQLQELSRLYH